MLRLTLTSSLIARRGLGEDYNVGEFCLVRHPFLRLQAGDPLLGGWAPLLSQGISREFQSSQLHLQSCLQFRSEESALSLMLPWHWQRTITWAENSTFLEILSPELSLILAFSSVCPPVAEIKVSETWSWEPLTPTFDFQLVINPPEPDSFLPLVQGGGMTREESCTFFLLCSQYNKYSNFFILFFNFTILYWFCHISKWICHRYTCVPHSEPSSLLPPHTIPLGHPSAPAPSIQYRALSLDWWLVSYMILYMFQCHSPKSSHPLLLPQGPKDCSIH